MSIEKKLFKALTSVIRSKSDLDDLKAHANAVDADFHGNALNPSKLEKKLARFFGAKDVNILSKLTKIDTIEKFQKYITDDFDSVFGEYSTFRDYNLDTGFMDFSIPIIDFKIKDYDNDGVKRNIVALMEVSFSCTENVIYAGHALYLYDKDEEEYLNLPKGWTIDEDDLTYALEDYLHLGKVQSKKATKEAIELLGYEPDTKFNNQMQVNDKMLVNDSSACILKYVNSKMKDLTGKSAKLYAGRQESLESLIYHRYQYEF